MAYAWAVPGTPALLTEGLTKVFGDTVALDNLDLRVEAGEVFGFLGPNGAGKTTTIRLLLDLIRPTSGRAAVFGMDCQRRSLDVRAITGYLAGDLRLYPALTGMETVHYIASLRRGALDVSYLKRLTDALELDLSKNVGGLSKGNRQKLGLVLALLGRPRFALLDEPTSGLDPIMQYATWEILKDAAREGSTVFFSSHVMSEVEATCERVGILRQGRLVAVEPIAALKERAVRRIEVSFADGTPPAGAFDVAGVREVARTASMLHFEATGDISELIKRLALYHVVDLKTEQPGLEEILLTYYRADPSA
jgi:ABC-2 type transport system ATP-binding protein